MKLTSAQELNLIMHSRRTHSFFRLAGSIGTNFSFCDPSLVTSLCFFARLAIAFGVLLPEPLAPFALPDESAIVCERWASVVVVHCAARTEFKINFVISIRSYTSNLPSGIDNHVGWVKPLLFRCSLPIKQIYCSEIYSSQPIPHLSVVIVVLVFFACLPAFFHINFQPWASQNTST